MWSWKRDKTMSDCCCGELLYYKTVKARFDAIDAQLELLIQAQERANAQAQAKIDAAAAALRPMVAAQEETIEKLEGVPASP